MTVSLCCESRKSTKKKLLRCVRSSYNKHCSPSTCRRRIPRSIRRGASRRVVLGLVGGRALGLGAKPAPAPLRRLFDPQPSSHQCTAARVLQCSLPGQALAFGRFQGGPSQLLGLECSRLHSCPSCKQRRGRRDSTISSPDLGVEGLHSHRRAFVLPHFAYHTRPFPSPLYKHDFLIWTSVRGTAIQLQQRVRQLPLGCCLFPSSFVSFLDFPFAADKETRKQVSR